MSLTYAQYVTLMKTMLVVDSETNANYVTILPSMIAYAEQRMYSEFDFLILNTEGTPTALVAGTNTVTIPSSIGIVQSAYIVTPAATLPAAGTKNPLQRVSLEFLNYVWPSQATTGVPSYYAMKTDTVALLAPTPDDVYKFVAVGPVRPAPLSSTNTTTYLTTYLDPLFVACSMIFGTGWQRDFGAQSDDPRSAMSWEIQYQTLKASADIDSLRQKAWSWSWQPYSPTPEAKESRT